MRREDIWDFIYFSGRRSADPGTVESAICGICDAQMDVERNVMGPTSRAESMGRKGHLHDTFTCPNLKEPWHKRVIELISEGCNTKSRKIRKILEDEIMEILATRKIPNK